MKKGERRNADTKLNRWFLEYFKKPLNDVRPIGAFYGKHPCPAAEMILQQGRKLLPDDRERLKDSVLWILIGVAANNLKWFVDNPTLQVADDGITGTSRGKFEAALRLAALADGGLILVNGRVRVNPVGPKEWSRLKYGGKTIINRSSAF